MKSPKKETKCFVGNDIIATNDISNRLSFSNPRYLNKILTDKEYLFFKENITLDYFPFLLWTCKESAYKIQLKEGLSQNFQPLEYEVEIHNTIKRQNHMLTSGKVNYGKKYHFFQSQIFLDYISTVACGGNGVISKTKNYVGYADGFDNSKNMRSHLIKRLADRYHKKQESFEILKTEEGFPYVKSICSCKMPDISFSHDGNYFSYALLF